MAEQAFAEIKQAFEESKNQRNPEGKISGKRRLEETKVENDSENHKVTWGLTFFIGAFCCRQQNAPFFMSVPHLEDGAG